MRRCIQGPNGTEDASKLASGAQPSMQPEKPAMRMKTGWRFASQNAYGNLKVRQSERRRSPSPYPWISPRRGKAAFNGGLSRGVGYASTLFGKISFTFLRLRRPITRWTPFQHPAAPGMKLPCASEGVALSRYTSEYSSFQPGDTIDFGCSVPVPGPFSVDLIVTMPDNESQVSVSWSGPYHHYYAPWVRPVPEPPTCAVMILGFAGVDFMAYRRSRSAALEA
jgi:hypothetical protein